jgi:hypothetical protein
MASVDVAIRGSTAGIIFPISSGQCDQPVRSRQIRNSIDLGVAAKQSAHQLRETVNEVTICQGDQDKFNWLAPGGLV